MPSNVWIVRVLVAISLLLVSANGSVAASQEHAESPAEDSAFLKNGSFEQDEDGQPVGWLFGGKLASAGYRLELDTNGAVEGLQAACLDSTGVSDRRLFGTLNQRLDASLFHGKRVKFRAAVRTADRGARGQAQLWLRADSSRDGAKATTSAFDNMGDRPITSDEWQHYEIIADIDEHAVRLTVGVLAVGSLKLWIDDASIEVLEEGAVTEAGEAVEVTTGRSSTRGADKAPIQPFYQHWLWLAAFGVLLVAGATAKNSGPQRFALRFSVIYWLFYSLPAPFSSLLAFVDLSTMIGHYREAVQSVVMWSAHNVLGIEGDLVLPNGSGDTTYAYVKLLVGFVLAFLGAGLWSAIDRKDRDRTWLRDLLRTYLRYVLGLTLLSYGLAKAGFIATQFGTAGEWHLARTYGSSSPMGLLWTFMAASPAYTFFSGVAEVVAGVLLIPRRTATLGGLAAFAVMLNVVLLNFCYDVPVKQYSSHLMLMGLIVALPDAKRLLGVLLFNRSTEPVEIDPPYTGKGTVWIYRALKLAAVIYLFVLPIYRHTEKEITHDHEAAVESKHLLMSRGFRWVNEYPFNR